jgi:type I restriction enzyme S subunit
MSLPRYPEYKPSGVEWLGELPEHWKTAPLKSVSTHNDDVLDETTAPDTEIAYVDISSVDGVNGIKTKEPMLCSAAPSRARRRVRHGDVIVSTVRTYLKAIARIRDPEENLIVSTGFAVIRPRGELTPDFLGCLVSASYFVEQVIARSTGVSYPAINASELVAIPVPVPPIPEQILIATFLDRETAKIDGLVAEQRRLMELLKEKRQAVISHAVTQGLNPHAPMKPSGIEWLGDIPAHWEIRKLKFLCDVQTGDKDTENAVEDGLYPFFVRSQTVERINSMAFDCEAVLTAGDGVGVGKVFHYYNGPFDFHQRVYMMNNFRDVSGPYLFHFFRENFYKVALEGGAKSTVDSFRRPVFMNFTVCVPPKAEQAAIVATVEQEAAKFDTLTAEAQRAIDLLQERRTALISAAVTGKIDVRKIAAVGYGHAA